MAGNPSYDNRNGAGTEHFGKTQEPGRQDESSAIKKVTQMDLSSVSDARDARARSYEKPQCDHLEPPLKGDNAEHSDAYEKR